VGNTDKLRDHHPSVDGGITLLEQTLPMVEIYETIEGEGMRAGFATVFVRVFGCNLRCSWCDTPYSYAPSKAERSMSIEQIVAEASQFRARHVCLTGGEPLMYGEKSLQLVQALAGVEQFSDIHIETNGAIDLQPFIEAIDNTKVRFIMDYKLHDSNETAQMFVTNLSLLRATDELKFVIASDRDFQQAVDVLKRYPTRATALFSPVWETMPPQRLAELILSEGLVQVRMSLQMHKLIWEAGRRGV
jgi:7-carboxy-7-deazaguanine synthase